MLPLLLGCQACLGPCGRLAGGCLCSVPGGGHLSSWDLVQGERQGHLPKKALGIHFPGNGALGPGHRCPRGGWTAHFPVLREPGSWGSAHRAAAPHQPRRLGAAQFWKRALWNGRGAGRTQPGRGTFPFGCPGMSVAADWSPVGFGVTALGSVSQCGHVYQPPAQPVPREQAPFEPQGLAGF